MRVYYYGCIETPGHFLHHESGRRIFGPPHSELIRLTLNPGELRGPLAPHRRDCSGRAFCYCSAGGVPEGQAALHQQAGWTALGFWDRSVDRRRGSTSVLFAEGTWSFLAMVALFQRKFPDIFNRFPFPIVPNQE